MIDGLPTATLTGADSELSIQIWLDNADDPFMWLNANLKTTGSNLRFDQTIEKRVRMISVAPRTSKN